MPDKAVPFTFIPSYSAAVPKITKDINFTFVAHGDFGSVIITEPSDYGATQVIKWNSKYIKFHYPSEHTYNGTGHDVEMQIYHEVSQSQDNHSQITGSFLDPCSVCFRYWHYVVLFQYIIKPRTTRWQVLQFLG